MRRQTSAGEPLPVERTNDERVARPAAGWVVPIVAGLSLLGAIAISDGAWATWSTRVTTLLPRLLLRVVFAAAVAAHVGEALYAARVAHRMRLPRSVVLGWSVQTLALGFPSLRLLTARRRAGSLQSEISR